MSQDKGVPFSHVVTAIQRRNVENQQDVYRILDTLQFCETRIDQLEKENKALKEKLEALTKDQEPQKP